ncbi:MAG: hypothetical protein JXR68_06970, partial [Bacteroidales bacterium]|nr:hypothetical protein [Bacteroidales bacterium]
SVSYSQQFEIFEGDTINYVDENNLKQGLWIFFNNNYANKISQKGYYKDSKKDGLWIAYYQDGTTKSEINFKTNRQYGSVKVYYPNGNLQECGYWKTNKWVGEYSYYYDNQQIKYHWFFDDAGKRTGKQDYYYDNGQTQITGNWTQGKEIGQITEYYPNGTMKKVSNFDNGTLNGSTTEYYDDGQVKSKSIFVNGQSDPDQSFAYQHKGNNNNNNQNNNNQTSTQDTSQSAQYRVFNGSGYYKFVNDKGLVEREGNFVNGTLVEGKRYVYTADGVLWKTAIIENGRVVEVIEQ